MTTKMSIVELSALQPFNKNPNLELSSTQWTKIDSKFRILYYCLALPTIKKGVLLCSECTHVEEIFVTSTSI